MTEENNINLIDNLSDSSKEIKDFLVQHSSLIENLGTSIKKETVENWLQDYSSNPEVFFNPDNLEQLKDLEPQERLAMLYGASSSLQVSLDKIKEYYKLFPGDLALVNANCSLQKGRPKSNFEWKLWIASQPLMTDCQAEWIDQGNISYPTGDYEQIAAIAARREHASKALISGFSDLTVDDFSFYGKASSGFQALIEDIRVPDYLKENKVDPKKIFTPDFLSSSEADQSAMLRQALACFQGELVFNEVYNSAFLPAKNGGGIAHSLLFKTKQKNSFYQDEAGFLERMDRTRNIGGYTEEHSSQRSILTVIKALAESGQTEKEKNIDLLLEFWDKNRNPLFSGEVARAFSTLDPDLAADKLLKMLKAEKGDKNFLSAMLYRLEFGKLNISEDGAHYLQKVYDLGECNNEDYHINRLTVDGDIGVFNEELELIKYFQLGELDSDDKKIKAKVLDFTYETLFIGSEDESSEERIQREKHLEEFKKNYFKLVSDKMFTETDVRLNNLSFKEQGWFLITFDKADKKKQEDIRALVAQQQEDGIKAFLSLEIDTNLGNKLISLNKNLPEVESRVLFFKLARITELASAETEALKEYFLTKGDPKNINWNNIRLSLLGGVKNLIDNFDQADLSAVAIKKLSADLDKVNIEIMFLSSLLRNVKENEYDLDWNLIKDLNLNIKDFGTEINSQDQAEILGMARANWEGFGNEKMCQAVVGGLEETLADSKNQRAYTLKYKEKVIGFVRFEKTKHETLYAGSFNVSKDLRGLNIGTEMMEQALMTESQKNILEASASIKIPAGCAYIEKVGFVADGIIENYHNSGEDLFNIRLDKRANSNYRLRNEAKESLISREDLKNLVIANQDLEKCLGDPTIVLSFDLKTEFTAYQSALSKLLAKKDDLGNELEDTAEKYTLTRYFQDKDKSGDVRILVFEKN